MWNNARLQVSWKLHLVAAGLISLLLPLAAIGAEYGDAFSGPVRVELNDGRSFSGRPVSLRDGVLLVRAQIDGGEVERGFPRDQIARVRFPGDRLIAEAAEMLDEGRKQEVLPILEALWRQRMSFFALVSPEVIDLLAALPAIYLKKDDPYRAIGFARQLLPHASGPAADRLHEAILTGHYQLEFFDDAEKLAREWVRAQNDFPSSALGWKILGDLALREQDLERAAWIALQPIVLAGPEEMPHLNGCYALAIHAFHLLQDRPRAQQLYSEMIERGLRWPDDPRLAETGLHYERESSAQRRVTQDTAEPDLDLRPPEEDLNLPLDQIRKILRTDQP